VRKERLGKKGNKEEFDNSKPAHHSNKAIGKEKKIKLFNTISKGGEHEWPERPISVELERLREHWLRRGKGQMGSGGSIRAERLVAGSYKGNLTPLSANRSRSQGFWKGERRGTLSVNVKSRASDFKNLT